MEMNQQQPGQTYRLDVVAVLLEIWRRLWVVILAAAVCGTLGYGYARVQDPVYRSRVSVMVNDTVTSSNGSVTTGNYTLAMHLANTYIVLVESDTILNDVIEAADLNLTTNQLKGRVNAVLIEDTEIFEIYVSGPNPVETQHIADTFLEVLPGRVNEIAEGSSLKVVDSARLGVKVGPNIPRTVMMGVLIGVALAVAGIILVMLFNDTIKDEDYLLSAYDLPLLASIPALGGQKTRRYGRYRYGYGYGYGRYYRRDYK